MGELSDEDKELCRRDRDIYGQYFIKHDERGNAKRIPPEEVFNVPTR